MAIWISSGVHAGAERLLIGDEFDEALFVALLGGSQIALEFGEPGFTALLGRGQVRPGALFGRGQGPPWCVARRG